MVLWVRGKTPVWSAEGVVEADLHREEGKGEGKGGRRE